MELDYRDSAPPPGGDAFTQTCQTRVEEGTHRSHDQHTHCASLISSPSAHGGVKPYPPTRGITTVVCNDVSYGHAHRKEGVSYSAYQDTPRRHSWFLKRCIPFSCNSVTFVAGYALKLPTCGD